MRALTVRQPWAWAIVHGGKDVENRTRNVAGTYRGPVAIHAGLRWDYDAFAVPRLRDALAWHGITADNATGAVLPVGAVIGVVDLVNEHGSPVGSRCCTEWAEPGAHHLVLANPRPLLKPVPCRGRLGLWTLPDDVADLLVIATEETR